jgi:hypothetical protein
MTHISSLRQEWDVNFILTRFKIDERKVSRVIRGREGERYVYFGEVGGLWRVVDNAAPETCQTRNTSTHSGLA